VVHVVAAGGTGDDSDEDDYFKIGGGACGVLLPKGLW
jgi:hypothetical protein